MWAGSRSKLLNLTCLISYETVRPRKVSWPLSPIPMYNADVKDLSMMFRGLLQASSSMEYCIGASKIKVRRVEGQEVCFTFV